MTAFLDLKRKHPLAECETCPLYSEAFVPTSGPKNAKLAVVSRSPGYYEAQKGQAFSGPSGKVLDHLLEQNGVKREDVLLTNTVLCTTQAPPTAAIKACSPRLHAELESVDTIIAAGSEAAKEILRVSSLSGNRGYRHKHASISGKWQDVVATNNPAIVLKEDDKFPNLVRDFRLAINPLPPAILPKVSWTNNVNTAREWLSTIYRRLVSTRSMENAIPLAVDIETKGLRHNADIVSIGFSFDGTKAIAVGEFPCSDSTTMQDYIRKILEDRKSMFLWHNGKFDVRNFRDKRIEAKVDEDTLLLSYACDERSDEGQVHSLEYLLMNELNWPNYEPPAVKNWKAKVARLEKECRFAELEQLEIPKELYEYNALDAAGTALLFPILSDRAVSDRVYGYYRDYLLPNANALIDVELRGINYDIHRAADINEHEVLPELGRLREEMRLIVGDGEYNPNSSNQNAALVYDKWHVIHAIDRGQDKERSVDKAVYTEIKEGRFVLGFAEGDETNGSDRHSDRDDGRESDSGNGSDLGRRSAKREETRDTAIRWAERLARFKELDKQRSTYIEGLIVRAESFNGKIYTDFRLHTVTGRSSSSRPNLQNVTRTKEGLPNIRSLFRASPGCIILQADYSQAELRCIAKLSNDRKLGDIYRARTSLHKQVAERFYGKNYTYEQYVHAKNMDFGVAYGQSADTFQEKHDIPVAEGLEFIDWWFKQFPDVKKWRQATAREVLDRGWVQSPFGHKRRFHLVTFENKKAVIREAINFRPQNIAAQLTLFALRKLVDLRLPVILTVHDQIALDTPKELVKEHVRIMKAVMEKAAIETIGWNDMPFEVDLQIGETWGELEEYE